MEFFLPYGRVLMSKKKVICEHLNIYFLLQSKIRIIMTTESRVQNKGAWLVSNSSFFLPKKDNRRASVS